MIRIAVLNQVILLDHPRHRQGYFISFCKRVLLRQTLRCRTEEVNEYLAYKLHNLIELLFVLQDTLSFCAQRPKLRIHIIVIGLEQRGVLGEADQPVHRRKVFPLCQLFIESPEDLQLPGLVFQQPHRKKDRTNLNNTQRSRGDRVSIISCRG